MFFFFQAEDGIRDLTVTGVQTCALPIFGACEAGSLSSDLHFGMLRRPPGAPANRNLLGQRESGGSALLLRRKQALRRSEERRVGKEWRSRWSVERVKKKRENRRRSCLFA